MRTHNICFCGEILENYQHFSDEKSVLSVAMLVHVRFCVEVLRPSQLNGVMSSAVSLPNHTFTGQA